MKYEFLGAARVAVVPAHLEWKAISRTSEFYVLLQRIIFRQKIYLNAEKCARKLFSNPVVYIVQLKVYT